MKLPLMGSSLILAHQHDATLSDLFLALAWGWGGGGDSNNNNSNNKNNNSNNDNNNNCNNSNNNTLVGLFRRDFIERLQPNYMRKVQ